MELLQEKKGRWEKNKGEEVLESLFIYLTVKNYFLLLNNVLK